MEIKPTTLIGVNSQGLWRIGGNSVKNFGSWEITWTVRQLSRKQNFPSDLGMGWAKGTSRGVYGYGIEVETWLKEVK